MGSTGRLPSDRNHVERCLLQGLSPTLRPLIKRIDEIIALERQQDRLYSQGGPALRAMVTPGAFKQLLPARSVSNFKKRILMRGRERLFRMPHSRGGKDFVIINTTTGTFRAWPASFHRPRKSRLEDPGPELDDLLAENLPERDLSTVLIRMSLAPTFQARQARWIDLSEPPFQSLDVWTADGHVLPQTYVLAVLPHLGTRAGLKIEQLDDDRLEVTWNGQIFAMREIIKVTDWIQVRHE